MSATEKKKAYRKAYRQRPEAKKRGRAYYQRPEVKERQRVYYQRVKERRSFSNRRRAYGLTREAFELLLAGQGGVCAVCGTADWTGPGKCPHVDHDHVTGKVRGLLCSGCNMAIGGLRDSAKIARAVVDYLERQE